MSEEQFPSALTPEDRKEWHLLCNRLFDLYESIQLTERERNLIAGGNGNDTIFMMFKGTQSDAFAIKYFLQKLDNEK